MSHIPLKISGFIDYTEKENRLFSLWKKRVEEVFSRYGFMGFQPRPVESIAALQTKGGITHQIYTLGRLQDGSMTDLALPFDRTVPLAIYVASHLHELTYPFKRFDISHCFRGERAQAGRFRGFIQADIDVVDEHISPLAEVECLATLLSTLQSLQIPPFLVQVNHIEIPKTLILHMGFTEHQLPEALRILDKMDKIGFAEVKKELADLSPSCDLTLLSLFTFQGDPEHFQQQVPLVLRDLPAFTALQNTLSLLKEQIDCSDFFAFCPGMVRGLDYYTGLVCETVLRDHSSFGSIASGGRYNNLIGTLAGDSKMQLEGFGLSLGLTRLFDILKRQELLPSLPSPPSQVLMAFRVFTDQRNACTIASRLRAKGISTDLYLGKGNLGKQLTYANKKEIPFAFILMGESFVIKDLQTGKQTEDIPSLDQALDILLSWLQ
ncbi:MAG: histidine--tRNA ligase family protein [Chlamydiae bacterium]|nr:histidine--tRNA ligase family protein [Chlamydiota bacterium]